MSKLNTTSAAQCAECFRRRSETRVILNNLVALHVHLLDLLPSGGSFEQSCCRPGVVLRPGSNALGMYQEAGTGITRKIRAWWYLEGSVVVCYSTKYEKYVMSQCVCEGVRCVSHQELEVREMCDESLCVRIYCVFLEDVY